MRTPISDAFEQTDVRTPSRPAREVGRELDVRDWDDVRVAWKDVRSD